jgi:hypothetical protein
MAMSVMPSGTLEFNRRRVLQRIGHELLEDRRGETAAGRALAHRARLVEADIEADDEVGRVADEPGVLFVVGRAGLAGDRAAELLRASSPCRAGPRLPSSR